MFDLIKYAVWRMKKLNVSDLTKSVQLDLAEVGLEPNLQMLWS